MYVSVDVCVFVCVSVCVCDPMNTGEGHTRGSVCDLVSVPVTPKEHLHHRKRLYFSFSLSLRRG